MNVRYLLYFVAFVGFRTLYPHGFAYDTYIRSGEGPGWFLLNQLAHISTKGIKQRVASYDQETRQWAAQAVKARACSKTNCYCRLSFDHCSSNDILCTPTQLFYRVSDHAWIPAYDLNSGDLLLGEHNSHVSVLAMRLVREPLAVYTSFNPTSIESYITFKNNEQDSTEKEKCGDAQAPGKPAEKDGFIPKKKWDGKKVRNPNGHGAGWPDREGKVWVPTGPKGHGGPHWDVQKPDGNHDNVYPGGKTRG